jgi:signal transduction histidine kinase
LRSVFAPAHGLLGRILAILLLTMLIEFGVSTLLYERATQFSIRDDEARRLAEHLVISRRLVEERPARSRPAMAAELSTDRYAVQWAAQRAFPPADPQAEATRRQILTWEPSLASSELRLRLVLPGKSSVVAGGLRLDDHSWLEFRTLEPVAKRSGASQRILLALVPAMALMLLGGMLVRRTLQPLRRLADAADRLGTPGGATHVEEDGPAEVRRVVDAFNRMQARIQRLITDRTDALAAVGHDLRTPLARLRLRSDRIEDAELRGAIADDLEEMDAMVASVLAFLGGDGDPEPAKRIDLAVLCATLVDDATDRGHDVTYHGPDHCEATIRPLGMKRALGNLIDNALHYGTVVTVLLSDTAGSIRVRVEDNGPGIPPDKLAAVVEPFVRLDTARHRDTRGFGLGLAIVTQALVAEGGKLRLTNREEGGLCAEIVLPRG